VVGRQPTHTPLIAADRLRSGRQLSDGRGTHGTTIAPRRYRRQP
jgi:hypothetical protein